MLRRVPTGGWRPSGGLASPFRLPGQERLRNQGDAGRPGSGSIPIFGLPLKPGGETPDRHRVPKLTAFQVPV
jgi:hypothetical protein